MSDRIKNLRIYVDTSVIGGCFDEQFRKDSRRLFQLAHEGDIFILVSDILTDELELAPPEVQEEVI